jgi:hypothetical protein
MAKTYEPIATQTLGTSAASVTFSSISGAYTDLLLVTSNGSTTATNTYVRLNGDSGSNYSFTQLTGTGSSAISGRSSNQTAIRVDNYASAATSITNAYIFQLQNYSNTTTYKTVLTRTNEAGTGVDATVGLWRNTAAITSILYYPGVGNWIAGSTFTLYGIKAA